MSPRKANEERRCSRCHTTNPEHLYASEKRAYCKDCQAWININQRAKDKTQVVDYDTFLTWKRSQVRQCTYCGISEADFAALGLVNIRSKRAAQTIGVDRIDSDGTYTLDNMTLCCLGCNQIKSNVLTADEMHSLGAALRTIWAGRIAAA